MYGSVPVRSESPWQDEQVKAETLTVPFRWSVALTEVLV